MNVILNRANRSSSECINCLVLICSFFFLPVSVMAELAVIYDSGNTKPTGIHLKEHRIQLSEVPPAPDLGKLSLTQYPVTATKLSVGPVKSQAVKLPPSFQPVFIVGSDELSWQWLHTNQDRLFELRAVGILTDAKSETNLKELKKQFPKLLFMPMSADAIAGYLPTKHYPVLITRERIEQ